MDIQIYSLDHCGFYKRGSQRPEFGGIAEWWEEFVQWVSDRPSVASTATFEESRRTTTQVYCTGTSTDERGNFGVTLWNRIPDTESGVAYIPVNSAVGSVTAGEQPLPGEDSIPGWPTYLWYLREYGVLVSLVPDNMRGFRSTGVPQARHYFLHYLKEHSPRYVDKQLIENGMTEATYEIKGYRRMQYSESDWSLTPYFRTSLFTYPGLPKNVRSRWQDIRKLVTETSVSTLQPNETNALDVLIAWWGGETVARTENENAKYRIAVDWKARSRQDVDQLIEAWRTRQDEDNYSVGVQFSGSGKIHWLGRVDGKGSVQIPNVISQTRLWKDEEVRYAWTRARPEVENILRSSRGQEDAS